MFKLAALSLGSTSTFNSTFETKFSNYGDAYQMHISEKAGINTVDISVTQPKNGTYTVTLTYNNPPKNRQTYQGQLLQTNFSVELGGTIINLKVSDVLHRKADFYLAK